ncbi:cobyrinic acid a,c-diamide synthase [Natronomonas salina]|uniref:cobyrinic acid a,c-diamide synthase n=1 Tax=Natronomonas salina TaxID=1710540 RepID=UPI0015B73B21|nr:cobyrinic acid a,c-diamide synthase [Natronomonas salina]QLD89831.1 cobyrinic acid a,c-diamide synthase [Natronomonas salina]
MKGVVIAGTASGVGKTVATLAALRALQRQGYDPQPAKAGPDFIDPSHHAVVCDRPSRSLDPWLSGEVGCRRNYWRGGGDVCVVEGMMGLYDGANSTAYVAETLDLPVVLVVDAAAGMESVAAQALGFREYAAEADRDVDVAGVLAQRAHGGRHAEGIREALPDGLEYVGRIPPLSGLEIPDRHLGLEMGEESPIDRDALEDASEHVDVDRLLDLAREPLRPEPEPSRPLTDTTVAVADDAAFCFSYPATRERLRERAEVTTFSPVAGDPVPDCDGVYLPGGYPELHGAELEAGGTLDELGDRAAEGLPVLGECGGFMALCETLTDAEGATHEMAGVLPADVKMRERYQALDHVELVARDDALTADAGASVRGHEFHYSSADVAPDASFAFDVEGGDGIADGKDGLAEYRTLGTYAHVHADSGAFDTFVERL